MELLNLKSSGNETDEKKLLVTLHELHHSNGGGYSCVPGMSSNVHYANQDKKVQLTQGRRLGATYAHTKPDCPQLQESVFLTPTSKNPYDPYEVNCLFKIGKYTNKKFMKVISKMKKKPNKKIGYKTRFGSSCRYRDWDRAKGGFYIWGVEENIAATLK